ncbi:hypothetical protein [Streptococcus pneumoniae]|uniref:hypothetical protein n=1 Tax=Streptococcus pneumoniae TaxID=1313 RepID=UPI000A68D704|nr:hypothetical protein [Streptococcus pneumoniae]
MKIKEQTRKLAAGYSKNKEASRRLLKTGFEIVDRTDEVSSKHCFEVGDMTKSVTISTARRS